MGNEPGTDDQASVDRTSLGSEAFRFDTSGVVATTDRSFWGGEIHWSDLSPFTQGYIEALFETLPVKERFMVGGGLMAVSHKFSDLAPETLARIIEDCANWLAEFTGKAALNIPTMPECGREFWRIRQESKRRTFPPLTITLGDDGKVRLADRVAA